MKSPLFILLLSSAFCFADALEKASSIAETAVAGFSDDDRAVSSDWVGKLSFGFDARSGNAEKRALSGAAEAARMNGEWLVRLSADGAWEETETDDGENGRRDERTVGNAHGHANVKYRLAGSTFVYAEAHGEHDDPAGVRYRAIEGGGFGAFLIDGDATKWSVELGYAGIQEELDEPGADDYAGLCLGERLDWRSVRHEGIAAFESCSFLLDTDDSDKYLVRAETGLDIPVVDSLALTLKYVWNFASRPSEGKDKDDRQFYLQASYVF